VRVLIEALDHQPLVELTTEQHDAAGDTNGPSRDHETLVLHDVRVREVDAGHVSVVLHGRVQQGGAPAVPTELELVEEPRSRDVEAELASVKGGKIAAAVGHHEGLVVLEHQLGQVGRDAGGENVVAIADAKIVAGRVQCHAAALASMTRR
jgi:hypothetical protein